MAKGRKPNLIPTVSKEVAIPARLAATWDLLLSDAARGKPEYGAWSKLVTRLLSEELQRRAFSSNQT